MKANDSYINQTASLREKLSQLNTEVTQVNSAVVTPALVSSLMGPGGEALPWVLPPAAPLAGLAFLASPFVTLKAV